MDAQAFTEQYRTIYQDLYRFALYTMRNPHDAEDAVSEAVLAGYTGMEGLRKDGAFKSWMFTITANVCRKKLRQQPPEPIDQVPEQPDNGPDAATALAVRQLFGQLPDEERVIVAMAVFGGYSSKEVGALLNLNPNTVRSKHKRALAKLAGQLKDVS
ncbi:RNA polymerase sigma factor [Parvibacter caecicola]|uniref:RNA polymerase sigma factor n=1 Tax=Parvibacter caecicola TaxID=747645 RepID=UPI00249B815E|nr:RNA polymerase sigma factor [Parvibacter caecicola]